MAALPYSYSWSVSPSKARDTPARAYGDRPENPRLKHKSEIPPYLSRSYASLLRQWTQNRTRFTWHVDLSRSTKRNFQSCALLRVESRVVGKEAFGDVWQSYPRIVLLRSTKQRFQLNWRVNLTRMKRHFRCSWCLHSNHSTYNEKTGLSCLGPGFKMHHTHRGGWTGPLGTI